ncbi:MAG: hypothetical protein FJ319_05630 [SAR202 cluster bacterium]|nr:hypothetical protein [SAR202 cluster bacterium]
MTDAELEMVSEYVAYVKHQARRGAEPMDPAQLASLYAEFSKEDSELAEAGLSDYSKRLRREDAN